MSLSLKKALFKKLLTLSTYPSAWLSVCRHSHILIILTRPIFVSRSFPLYASVWGKKHIIFQWQSNLDFPRSLTDKICIHLDLPFYAFQHTEFLFHFMLTHVSCETKIPVYLQLFNQCKSFLCVCIHRALKTHGFHLTATKLVFQDFKHYQHEATFSIIIYHSLSLLRGSHVARELYSTVSKSESGSSRLSSHGQSR